MAGRQISVSRRFEVGGRVQTNLERSTMTKRETDIGQQNDAPLTRGFVHHCAAHARRIVSLVREFGVVRARHG
jgi:hypothetical protein